MSLESYEIAINSGMMESNMPFEIWEKCHRDIISTLNVPCSDGVHFARVIICTRNPIIRLNVEWGEVNPERYTAPAIIKLVDLFISQFKAAIGCPIVGNTFDSNGEVIRSFEDSLVELDTWYSNWKAINED